MRRKIWTGSIALAFVMLTTTACDVRRAIMREIARQNETYFSPPGTVGWEVEQLTDHVYTFRWHWYRNIFVVTDEGVFATDPFNPEAAALMRDAIREKAGNKPVKYLFYTHYHKDHVEGGALLEPEEVICHERCAGYFKDIASPDILSPTRTLSGSTEITLGGITLKLIYLGKTHTDTLYVVHIPQENLLFTADFGLVKTLPPIGLPDFYRPGTFRAMEQVSKLDFDTWVPSHFGHGTKKEFVEYMEMMQRLDQLVAQAREQYGRLDENLVPSFTHVYDGMKAEYGDWHGFDQMILFSFSRTATGQLLGY